MAEKYKVLLWLLAADVVAFGAVVLKAGIQAPAGAWIAAEFAAIGIWACRVAIEVRRLNRSTAEHIARKQAIEAGMFD